ncbi:HdeD family acid-resistance protein [Prevotella sp. 10(H)]|uniref:HdeD family acid-resistance protein n=1 Tax=Prevotella sp. 10(H) TaxID=1158294 RepID=UPI0004A758D4|nr:HdeD family acid-resistance protein [Prevotella sp. 10(H)]
MKTTFLYREKPKYWWMSLLIGILALIMGVVSLVTPDTTLVALTVFFITMFFISGIIDIIYAVSNRKTSNNWGWALTGGIIDIVLGVLLVCMPLPVVTTMLVYFVGFWILFRSILSIGLSCELQQQGVKGWGWLLALSILGILFSIFYMLSPVLNGLFVVMLVSIAFMTYGIFRISYAFKIKSINDLLKKDK